MSQVEALRSTLQPALCVETLNCFFSSLVSDQLVSHYIPLGPVEEAHTSYFTEVSCDHAQQLLESVDVNKATSSDGIPATILKTCADILAETLKAIFNKTLQSSTVSLALKCTNIKLLLKSLKLDTAEP